MSEERRLQAIYGHTLEMEGDRIVAITKGGGLRRVELGQRVKASDLCRSKEAGAMGTVEVIYDPHTRQTSDYIGVRWDDDKIDFITPTKFEYLVL